MLIQRQCSVMARAPTPPRQKPSDWLTRVTPARSNNISASLLRNVFVLTRCFPERLKNANLSFRKQLKNDLKATRAGQTWLGVEKKRHQCFVFCVFVDNYLRFHAARIFAFCVFVNRPIKEADLLGAPLFPGPTLDGAWSVMQDD